jgi:gluconolactonase
LVSTGPAAQTGTIEKADAALDRIVPADAKIEKLAEGFSFTEGPIWFEAGYLLFSDIPQNEIHKWTPDGKVTLFRKPSGYDLNDAPPGAFIGSNGLTIDQQGRLIICEHGNHRVTRLEKDGALTVLADKYEGKRLNSPNDVVQKSNGDFYFTDPPYGLPKLDEDPKKELDFNGVYRLSNGKLHLLYKELLRPNGLAFSPDEKYMYLNNSEPERKICMRFEVRPDGGLAKGEVFFDITRDQSLGVPDGMKIDKEGNVYSTGPSGVWIFTSEGKHLGTIKPPEVPANIHWGGADARTLFMTARTGLYRIKLNIVGIRP